MSVHPVGAKTALILVIAPVKSSISRGGSEMNAIIHASRVDMLGATLYLVGREVSDGSYVQNASPCSMCARLIINAGISTVVVRDTRDAYRVYDVNEAWVEQDESLSGLSNY